MQILTVKIDYKSEYCTLKDNNLNICFSDKDINTISKVQTLISTHDLPSIAHMMLPLDGDVIDLESTEYHGSNFFLKIFDDVFYVISRSQYDTDDYAETENLTIDYTHKSTIKHNDDIFSVKHTIKYTEKGAINMKPIIDSLKSRYPGYELLDTCVEKTVIYRNN